jgi:hypothetical protein
MNEQQLENLLEETMRSLQSSIPAARLFTLDVSNQAISTQSTQQQSPPVHFDTSDNQVRVTESSSSDNDIIQHLILSTMVSEYQENMRIYQQNMSSVLRTTSQVNRNRLLRRQLNQHSSLNSILSSFPERFFSSRPNSVLTFEFQAPPRDSLETSDVPTLMQYTNATSTFILNSTTVNRLSDNRCPITLEDFEHGELLCEIKHCRHIFKESSLRSWFVRNTYCPVCRYDIRHYTTTTST